MKSSITVQMSEREVKQALSDYIVKNTNLSAPSVGNMDLTFMNGTSKENCLFSSVDIKISADSNEAYWQSR